MRECCECKWYGMIPMVVRGVMDADPAEYYCDKDGEMFRSDNECEDFEWRIDYEY